MKKKLLILMGGAFLLLQTAAKAQVQTLVLHHVDGKTTEVELYTMPRIQLTADKMTITSQGVVSQEFDKTDVVRFTYKSVDTGIRAPKPEMAYRIDEDRVTFHGVPEANAVKVYNVGGVQIPVSLQVIGSDAILPLTQLPQGVYLVTITGRTLKFIRP